MTPVPPRSAMSPRRKQKLYDFAEQVYEYGVYLKDFVESSEMDNLTQAEKDIEFAHANLVEALNAFQVAQITDY